MTDIEKQVYKKFNAGIAAEDEALGGLSIEIRNMKHGQEDIGNQIN